jgi:hypothetical protein
MGAERYVDESRIEEANDATVQGDPALLDHVHIANECFVVLSEALRVYVHTDAKELIVLRLAVRLFNDAGAALKCAKAGYYQPAFMIVRDLVETGFLIDLFGRDRSKITEWGTATDKDRRRKFSPVAVRDQLDKLDGFAAKKRQRAYADFSFAAAHPDPRGFSLISPENMTQIGPFPDKDRITAFLEELARHLPHAVALFLRHLPREHEGLRPITARFHGELAKWMQSYSPSIPGSGITKG